MCVLVKSMNLDKWRLSRNTWTWKALGLIPAIFLRTLEWFNPLRAYLQTNFAVQLRSLVQLFVTPWTVACQAPLSSSISWSLLKFMYIELVIVSNHLILCHPLLLSSVFASATVLPVNIQGWFPLGVTALISLLSKGISRVFSRNTIWKHQFFL